MTVLRQGRPRRVRTPRSIRSCSPRGSCSTLQTIVSREINPLDPAVVTVGSIHGGTKHNIIPDEVKLQLTVRSYKPEVRETPAGRDRADREGRSGRRRWRRKEPRDEGHREHARRLITIRRCRSAWPRHCARRIGADNVTQPPIELGSEDFSRIRRRRSAGRLSLGRSGRAGEVPGLEARWSGASYPLTRSLFAPDREATLKTGILGETCGGRGVDEASVRVRPSFQYPGRRCGPERQSDERSSCKAPRRSPCVRRADAGNRTARHPERQFAQRGHHNPRR